MTHAAADPASLEREAPLPLRLRHPGAWLGGVLALALGVRLAYWDRTAAMFNDGPLFLALAQAAEQGDLGTLLNHPYHPLYPLVTVAAHALVGDWVLAAVGVSVVSGLVAVVCLHAFVRRAFGPGHALVAALLLAVHPYATRFSADVMSDGLYLACLLFGVAGLWAAYDTGRARGAVAAGVAAGLAYLVRPEGLGVLGLGIGLAGVAWLEGRFPLRRVLAGAAALLAGALLVVGPYVVALRAETGEWQLTQKKAIGELLRGQPERPGGADPSAAADPDEALAAARGQPDRRMPETSDVPLPGYQRGDVPRGVGVAEYVAALREVAHTAVSALRPELALLVAVGALTCRGRPSGRAALVLGAVVLYGTVLWLLRANAGYVSRRHVLPPAVLSFGYAAAGALACMRVLAAAARRWGLAPATARIAAAGLVIGGVAVLGVGKAVGPTELDHLAARRAAEWLDARAQHVGTVAAQKRREAWYAGGDYFPLRAAPQADTVAYLRAHGVRYVIAERGLFAGLEAAVGTGALRLLHEEEAGRHRVGVFELSAEAGSPAPAPGGE